MRGSVVFFYAFALWVCLWPQQVWACGFPHNFNQLRVSMEDVATFRDLQKDRRLARLSDRLKAVDYVVLETRVHEMGYGHRMHEVQRLLSLAEGVASGMMVADRDVVERLLRRLGRMEANACRWTRHLPGMARPGSDGRFLWIFSLTVLLGWAVFRMRSNLSGLIQQSTLCQIPATLGIGPRRLEVEIVELSRVGCRLVPEHATKSEWIALLEAQDTQPSLEIGPHQFTCKKARKTGAAVALAFCSKIDTGTMAQALAASRTRPVPNLRWGGAA